jgi:hypothetical protein
LWVDNMIAQAPYVNIWYERNEQKFDSPQKVVFPRSDTVVLLGIVAGASLSNLTTKATVCKVLPDGSISSAIYSRSIGSGITISNLNDSEKRLTIVLIGARENAGDEPGQQYVADVEISYGQDFTAGTTVGTATAMVRTIKGAFSIERDYTII